jgi:hypothetical protein
MVSLTNGSWRGYRCRKRLEGGAEACSLPYVSQSKVEEMVAATLLDRLDALCGAGVSLVGSPEDSRQAIFELESDLNALHRRLSECRRAEERWLRLFERGEVQAEWGAVEQRLAELRRERVSLESLHEKKALELQMARESLDRLKEQVGGLVNATTGEVAGTVASRRVGGPSAGSVVRLVWAALSTQEKAAVARLLLKEVRVGPSWRLEIHFWAGRGRLGPAGGAGDLT